MNPKKRSGGSTYYPGSLLGIYQSAQKMGVLHICGNCTRIPLEIKQELLLSRDEKSSSGSGKRYWADAAKALGVYEDDVNGCLRFYHCKGEIVSQNLSSSETTSRKECKRWNEKEDSVLSMFKDVHRWGYTLNNFPKKNHCFQDFDGREEVSGYIIFLHIPSLVRRHFVFSNYISSFYLSPPWVNEMKTPNLITR